MERRKVERQKTTNGALIFSSEQRGIMSCAMRDVSDIGVGLLINERNTIAPIFKITLDNFKSVRAARVVWSRGRYVGAVFSLNYPEVEEI